MSIVPEHDGRAHLRQLVEEGVLGVRLGTPASKEEIRRAKLSQMSKAEELAVLERLEKQYRGSNTYLSRLFAPALVEWFRQKLADDWSCDLAEEMASLRKAANSAGDLVRSAEIEGERRYNAVQAELNESARQVNALAKDAAELKRMLENERAAREEAYRNEAALGRKLGEAQDKRHSLELSLVQQQRVNQALKAQLYDLEHPEVDPDAQD